MEDFQQINENLVFHASIDFGKNVSQFLILNFYISHSIVNSFANAFPLRKFEKILVPSLFRKINNSFSLVIEFPDRMISPAYFFFSLCLAPSNM